MKIAVPPWRRRLLVLCACSAALHLALLALFVRHGAGTPAAAVPVPGDDLRILLARPAASPPRAPAPGQAAPHAAPSPQRQALRPPSHPTRLPPEAPAVTAPAAAGAPTTAATDAPAPPLVQMPGRYRVRLPGSVELTYAQVVERPGAAPAPAGPARIDWRTDGVAYRLDVDGVLGRLRSEGGGGDAGIVPQRATEERGGGAVVTEFDPDGGRVRFRAGGGDAPYTVGMQDRASLLLQLAAIGLGEPDQVQDRIDVAVAGAGEAAIARFDVVGNETVATGMGPVAAWHLAELAAPGRPRMEVWLAPAHEWLPVQVRVSGADGSAATQTLSALARGPSAAP